MRINEVIAELKKTYPGKSVVLNNRNNLTEILCEIEPSQLHPSYSVAIGVIDETTPHYHKKSTETYEVIKGELDLIVEGKTYHLKPGESFTMQPQEIHSAKGDETWVKCTSKPGWNSDDHIRVEEKRV
ncbi:cupin domain-containing protein [Candidatus Roizmanbacteria bacterium]|nr:cupin domain-containing protein [Candidatus Roizmanbacteria bacterium]